ncbi:phosphonate ABC transporter ATP-binding protein [Natrinema saccharevitans]|uniref:Phosphonate ABC transporter ATP-binding protein n=1 Tax=Natrinema saccharevitans TaxID=301967 RepID=A0A1S8AS71_9EURY|nr:phosphonate ABC transporter ATP-binding protein [Natrinema saccharevitans]
MMTERHHELRFDGLTKTFDGDRPRSADVAHAYPGGTLVDRRTALANVLVGSSLSRSWWRGLLEPLAPRNPARALELLDRVGLDGKADARTDTLSAGERQRVAFARALMQDAPVIVADEPTANLDPSSSITVLDVLEDVAGKRMLITVLHDMDLAVEHYDRIVGIVDGSVRFDRPAESITAAELEELSDRDDADASAVAATESRPPRDADATTEVAENRYSPARHWK